MEREKIIAKKIEAVLGLVMLLPALIGIISFFESLFRGGFDLERLKLYGSWAYQWNDDGGIAMSPAPVFLGLLAIAAVLLLKDSIYYLFLKTPPKE